MQENNKIVKQAHELDEMELNETDLDQVSGGFAQIYTFIPCKHCGAGMRVSSTDRFIKCSKCGKESVF